jgi:hypothetical protein
MKTDYYVLIANLYTLTLGDNFVVKKEFKNMSGVKKYLLLEKFPPNEISASLKRLKISSMTPVYSSDNTYYLAHSTYKRWGDHRFVNILKSYQIERRSKAIQSILK